MEHKPQPSSKSVFDPLPVTRSVIEQFMDDLSVVTKFDFKVIGRNT